MQTRFGRAVVELVRGDITAQSTDAVVNAANARLLGGGGVDGAIHDAGGPEIAAEIRRDHPDGCPTGEAVLTGAGRLPARYVIHAVGPVYRADRDAWAASMLASAYRNALRLAVERSCRSVALPSLSTGAYGYPVAAAARVALSAVREFLTSSPGTLELVRWVLFDEPTADAYRAALAELTAADAAASRASAPSSSTAAFRPTTRPISGESCPNPLCRAPLPVGADYCPRCGRRLGR
jgi:O-acetyl-ADP-ribose deacetylase (regulator of RNase III)